jgi:putative membrane protein insertion efficiency factor
MCDKHHHRVPDIPPPNGLVARGMIVMVRGYQLSFSAIFGRTCRHLPSCSSYTIEAISRFGPWRGLWLGLARLARCNPWGSEGYDPVPETLSEHGWRFWRNGVWRK